MNEDQLNDTIKYWQNKLMDLSRRNRMISLKDTSRQVIRFVEPDFAALYRRIVIRGSSMEIMRPIDAASDRTVYSIMRLMTHLAEPLDIGIGEIRTGGTLESSLRTVQNIKRYADRSFQEKGTNVLYLAFGFLYWHDLTAKSEWTKAPLVLVPVSLTRAGINKPFSLHKTEEEIIVNPTLAYFLRTTFKMELPELRNVRRMADLETFLNETEKEAQKLGWRVEREVYLSTMSFLKTNMYQDLIRNEQMLREHPVIRALAGDTSQLPDFNEGAAMFSHDIQSSEEVCEVLDADSSQKDAIALSRSGISFVMQGPPGTGKSQTIANIIAQGIADGRSVLFVSEKQAALDVVYRRLQDAGIDRLCLPLHNPKTSAQTVLGELSENLDAPKKKPDHQNLSVLHRADQLRNELNAYVEQLHETNEPLGISVYDAIMMLLPLDAVPDILLSFPKLAQTTRSELDRMIQSIAAYEKARDSLDTECYTHPFSGIRRQRLSGMGKQRLHQALIELEKGLEDVCGFCLDGGRKLGEVLSWGMCEAYIAIGRQIADSTLVPSHLVLEEAPPEPNAFPGQLQEDIHKSADFLGIEDEHLLSEIPRRMALCQETVKRLDTLLASLPENGRTRSIKELSALMDERYRDEDRGGMQHYLADLGIGPVGEIAPKTLDAMVEAIASGRYDRYASLRETELHFTAELIAQARRHAQAQDAQWLLAHQELLMRYTGMEPVNDPGTWEQCFLWLNDFYYIRKAFPSLLAILSLRPEERTALIGMSKTNAIRETLADKADLSMLRQQLHAVEEALRPFPALVECTPAEAADVLRKQADMLQALLDQAEGWREVCDAAVHIRHTISQYSSCPAADILQTLLGSTDRMVAVMEHLCGLRLLSDPMDALLHLYEDPCELTDTPLCDLLEHIRACRERWNDYDNMVELRICEEQCRADGLSAFLDNAWRARREKGTLSKMFEKAFLTLWIDSITAQKDQIASFSPLMQDQRIREFRSAQMQQRSIAPERVRAIAYEKMPSRSAGKVIGEMGILLREIGKSRNSMSIRQLFSHIPKLLLQLKPCLMMSPLSVAYFLDAGLFRFDLVIFDEASQIFPEHTIGAILRGNQIIISGDSRQMPPTRFFQASAAQQAVENEEEQMENAASILEETENILPNVSLTWHYRSRFEQLIAYSNHRSYADCLVTFPSTCENGADCGVEYVYVDNGIYENRCNEMEAQVCVRLAVQHFRLRPERSLGIIAFSITQEECISRAFDAYRSLHPEYEPFFAEDRENPFFIKNLENVQGDERDTIILSVGYGKNAQGTLRYNFGPLGMQGGDRRLNVAITRARYHIQVVTSLLPDDFDAARLRTNAGAELLCDYLRFASHPVRLKRPVPIQQKDALEQCIDDVLREAGYQTAQQVGISGCKIAVAVESPVRPGCYIAGIETDGASYFRIRTGNDRECLRPTVLESRGWSLYRVWSVQWLRNPETERCKLLAFVAECAAREREEWGNVH